MKKTLSLSLALLAGALSTAAYAAPGEWWEISSKTEMPGMPFSMPESTIKVCVAKDSENDPRQTMQDKECKMTDLKTSGNKTTWKMRCVRNGEVMNGNGEYISTKDGYQGVTHLSGKSGGQAMDMTSHFRGKRVGPKCDAAQAETAVKQEAGKASAKPEPETPASGNSMMDGAKKLKGMFGF